MDLVSIVILGLSLAICLQAGFGLYLTLYAWEHPEHIEAGRSPEKFARPRHSFTALLPARHEERVIYETIGRISASRYPQRLLEIIVICHVDDWQTIEEARRAQRDLKMSNILVETFRDPPINKPHGLNLGLAKAKRQFVTVFDAEDDVHPDLFRMVNTVLVQQQVRVVQAGVQLMNFRDHWFGIHNCLEYFFWFKSRLHFHARAGMIPLGGNTVFIRRELLREIGGWDESCLTEDADIGVRLSAVGERIAVVYDPRHVTREETPDSVSSWIRQRTRWNQGFIYLMRKGSWLELPTLQQRLLALYTLSYPITQSVLFMLWPTIVFGILLIKVPVPVALVSFLPLYALAFQFVVQMIGAFLFTREYGMRLPITIALTMPFTFLPYQWLLGVGAVRAVYRELEIRLGWEKTHHAGAHRTEQPRVFQPRPAAVPQVSAATIVQTIAPGPALQPPSDSPPVSGPPLRHCPRCGHGRAWTIPTCPVCTAQPMAHS